MRNKLLAIDDEIKSLLDEWKRYSDGKNLPYYLRLYSRGTVVWWKRGKKTKKATSFFDTEFQSYMMRCDRSGKKMLLQYERDRSQVTYQRLDYATRLDRVEERISYHKKLTEYERKGKLRG